MDFERYFVENVDGEEDRVGLFALEEGEEGVKEGGDVGGVRGDKEVGNVEGEFVAED